MDINKLVNITSRAWALKILALMYEGVPGRQAPLIVAAKAGRTAFVESLNHLTELNLLERNPGYGHPLRPEYRLTKEGHAVAPIASRIVKAAEQQSQRADIIRKSWTVPILAVTKEPKYFVEIKSALPTVTDRALSQSLTLLHKHNWLRRDVDVTMRPPRPLYCAKDIGVEISGMIDLN